MLATQMLATQVLTTQVLATQVLATATPLDTTAAPFDSDRCHFSRSSH